MTAQSIAALVFISLSGVLAAKGISARHKGSFAFVAICCAVVLGGALALWLVPAAAGWLTAILFTAAIVWPIAFASRAARAEERGEWDRAARLLRWATIFYRTAGARAHLDVLKILHLHDRGEVASASARIEALNTPILKNNACLYLAFAQRDWPSVLAFARAEEVGGSANGMEIRALGELGLIEEMMQAYQKIERGFPHPYLVLNILAFTGQVEHVEQMLNGHFRNFGDDDNKSYWEAVALLRRDPDDQAARRSLVILREAAPRHGLRLAAAAHLQNLGQTMGPSTPLSAKSQAVLFGMIENVQKIQRLAMRQRRHWKATWRAAIWLVLIWIVLVLLG